MTLLPFSRRALALAFLIVAAGAAFAQAPAPARKTIGLVLGGGGARGSAHLGVLEVLEENRIIFDCVAGTSMGALMAGAYSAGVSPAEMKALIRKTDWAAIFDDSAGRDLVNLRRKQLDDRFYSGLEFGVGKNGLTYREGAIAGEKIKLLFNEMVREDLGERSIEDLPLPLSIIATDIGTGERVVMRKGNLTSAMRASMSVPGALAPVMREGRKLVDGGLVDNVPIGEVRERCNADVVIAVNVGSPMAKPEEVTGVVSVVGQMVNLLAEQNVARSLQLLRPQDIYIRPELGDLSAADFGRQLEGAEMGRKAALEVVDRLSKLSAPPEQYRVWRASVRLMPSPKPPVIDEVRIADTRFVNKDSIRAGLRTEEGKALDTPTLAKDMVWVYSQGDLQGLDYNVLKERDKTILRITPVEKAWGPDYLRFGINFSSDFEGEADYNIRALYRMTWLNRFGGEWLLGGQMGSEQLLATEFYQPLDYRQISFVRPYVSTRSAKTGLYLDGDRVAEYRIRESDVGFEGGANLGIYGQAKAGYIWRQANSKRDTGSAIFPNVKDRVSGLTANLDLDTQDQAFFPTRGYRANADYFRAYKTDTNAESGELPSYWRFQGGGEVAVSQGDFTLIAAAEGGKTSSADVPFSDIFKLGGPRRLSGFANGQILGTEYAYGRLEGQWRLTKPLPLIGLNLIAGALLEGGKVKDPINEPNLKGWQNSFGAYIAANTFFGPIYLGYGDSTNGKSRLYLFIGTP